MFIEIIVASVLMFVNMNLIEIDSDLVEFFIQPVIDRPRGVFVPDGCRRCVPGREILDLVVFERLCELDRKRLYFGKLLQILLTDVIEHRRRTE